MITNCLSPNGCLPTGNNNKRNIKDPCLLHGISVDNFVNVFAWEVEQTPGLSRDSKIYEAEDLDSVQHGVIRSRGADRMCPQDGREGCAYVDTFPNARKADFMISYSWGYTINDICETLLYHCKSKGLDPEDAFVWICCLCNNQHRVHENKIKGIVVDFEETFHSTVTGIGHLVAMMFPWDRPLYLERIWCIFEIYTATTTPDCQVTIAMPPRTKSAMIEQIENMWVLYDALARTDVLKAQASVESDKKRILKLIEDGKGYSSSDASKFSYYSTYQKYLSNDIQLTKGYVALNQTVNTLIRNWVNDTLEGEAEMSRERIAAFDEEGEKERESKVKLSNELEEYATLCLNIGEVMRKSWQHEKCLDYLKRSLEGFLKVHDSNHEQVAKVYSRMGLALSDMGHLDQALRKHHLALNIQHKVLGKHHQTNAISHDYIGSLYLEKGDLEKALEEHKLALDIRIKVLRKDDIHIATSYNNIGRVLAEQGKLNDSIVALRKGIAIERGFGSTQIEKSDKNFDMYSNELNRREKTRFRRGNSATSPQSLLGRIFMKMGKFDLAERSFYRAVRELQRYLGREHPCVATALIDIGYFHAEKSEFDKAQEFFHEALEMRLKVFGQSHIYVANTYIMIGKVFEKKRGSEKSSREKSRGDFEDERKG